VLQVSKFQEIHLSIFPSKTALYLLLPVHGLLSRLSAQAVSPLASVHVKEAPFVCFFRCSWGQTGWLCDIPNLAEIDCCAHELVLLGVVVHKLVLDGVQLEPPQLPGLQQGPPLVEIALVQYVGVPRLCALTLAIVAIAKAVLTSPNCTTSTTTNIFSTLDSSTSSN